MQTALRPAHLLAASALCVAVAAPSNANAQKPSRRAVHTVEVEIAETSKSGTRRVSFAVGVSEGGRTSEVSTHVGGVTYEVSVEQGSGGSKGPLFYLGLSGHGGSRGLNLTAAARPNSGKRTVVGRVAHPDGSTVEVAIRLL